jgi:hypothetical protein
MRRLSWNFAPRRRLTWQWTSVYTLTLLACFQAVLWRQDLLQERDNVIARLNESPRQLARADRPVSPTTPAALKQIFSEMQSPWTDMLDSLQHITRPGIELISLEPEGNLVHRFHISGMASRAQDVFDFVEALQSDHSWSSVELVSQTSMVDKSILKTTSTEIPSLPGLVPSGVSFSVVAEWGRP